MSRTSLARVAFYAALPLVWFPPVWFAPAAMAQRGSSGTHWVATWAAAEHERFARLQLCAGVTRREF